MSASEMKKRQTSARDLDDEALLSGLGGVARAELDSEPLDASSTVEETERHRAARDRALAAARTRRRPRSFAWRPSLAAAVALAAALAALFGAHFYWKRAHAPLGFVVMGQGSPDAMPVIRAGREPVRVRFDDGTEIAFAPGAKGRIADVTSHGARVIVAEGKAHFDVRHLDGAAWTVEAGSYVVRVTGTEFDVDWSPRSATLRVVMQRGSVAVEGGRSAVPALVGGNVLDIDPAGAILIRSSSAVSAEAEAAPAPEAVSSARAGKSADTDPPTLVLPSSSGSAAALSPSGPTSATAAAPPKWSALVASGDYASVVREATSRGVDTVMKTAPLDDLVALGDAARYSGRGDLSQSALEAIRARFAQSPPAHTAAFLLGRMADDRGSFQEAIALYDEYLAGGGPFSGEALGRKMIALGRSGKKAEAQALAAHYLDEHPDGAYASVARGLVEGP